MKQETGAPGRAAARRRARALLACSAMVAGVAHGQATPPAPAPAAAPAPMQSVPVPSFSIRGFKVTGENPLPEDETQRILAPFVRPDATMDSLQQATVALEAVLRQRGYGLHRVALPPQEVGETVTLNVVSFTISKVTLDRVEGQPLIYDDANVRRSLPELEEGKTPNFKRLAIQTAISNENPNKQIQLGIKESDEPDKIDSTIVVKENKPWSFAVTASNAGTPASGKDRVTLSAAHTNVWNLDHQFQGAYTTSVERTADVKQLGLSYRAPFYALGGVAGASYTQSDVVGNFGAFTSTGAGRTMGVSYSHYLPPEGGRRSYITVSLDDKLFNASKVNDIVIPGTFDRRSRPITVSWAERNESDTSTWSYNIDVSVNTNSGAQNDLVSYQSEDNRITTTSWKVLRGGFNYIQPVFDDWTFSARGMAQYASTTLLAGEQFGLGGLGSVRGTSTDRPISADAGMLVNVELMTPDIAYGVRLLGFFDSGWLANHRPTSATKPHRDRISSIGIGLRWVFGASLSASADYGKLINSSKVPLAANAASPQKGDDRVSVSVSYRF